MTCGNVLGGQRNGNAIAGRGRLTDGACPMVGRSAELEFRGSAACRVCSALEGTPGANSGSGSCSQWARWTTPSWPNPTRWSHRRQGNDLRATAPTASGRYADSLGALKARAPSRTSTQGSRSRRVVLILERCLHSCDELHVARRDAQVAAPAHSKKRRNRMACRATDVFARLPRPTERLDPLRGRTGGVSPPGRRRARHLQREPPRLRGSVDFGAAPLAAERGRAAAARAGRGAGPPSCSRKAARGGAATLGAELRA